MRWFGYVLLLVFEYTWNKCVEGRVTHVRQYLSLAILSKTARLLFKIAIYLTNGDKEFLLCC